MQRHERLYFKFFRCIYVSGVPGTGKTATVNEAIKCLNACVKNGKLKEFDYVDINGMRLSEPRQAYVQIYKQLTGENKLWEESQNLLQKRFTKKTLNKKMTLILVDEVNDFILIYSFSLQKIKLFVFKDQLVLHTPNTKCQLSQENFR